MQQLQELRDEFQFHQSTTHPLDLPRRCGLVFTQHQTAHVHHVFACDDFIAGTAQAGCDGGVQAQAKTGWSRDNPGAGEGQLFPGPGRLFLIGNKTGKTNGNRAFAAGGTQPHVHLIEHAFSRGRRQRRDEALGQTGIVLADRQRPVAVRNFCARGMGINQHEIQIGPRRHFAAPQFAHGDDSHLAALNGSVGRSHMGFCSEQQTRQQHICQIGKTQARCFGTDGFRQHTHPDAKFLFTAKYAGAVHDVVERYRSFGLLVECIGQSGGTWQIAKETRFQNGFQHTGLAAQAQCESWGGSQYAGDQCQKFRIGFQHREQLHTCGQAFEKTIKTKKAAVGVAILREGLQQFGHQFGQGFTGAAISGGVITAEMPAAHNGGNF